MPDTAALETSPETRSIHPQSYLQALQSLYLLAAARSHSYGQMMYSQSGHFPVFLQSVSAFSRLT
ncbi:hypothetical protein A2U01_0071264, partial [Trifolium medium]|nr:hypothetical protein [Trifolium medium]